MSDTTTPILNFGLAQQKLVEAGVGFPDFVIQQPARDELERQAQAAVAQLREERDTEARQHERLQHIYLTQCERTTTAEAQRDEAVRLLRMAVKEADSWAHDQLEGTGLLEDSLATLAEARAFLKEMTP